MTLNFDLGTRYRGAQGAEGDGGREGYDLLGPEGRGGMVTSLDDTRTLTGAPRLQPSSCRMVGGQRTRPEPGGQAAEFAAFERTQRATTAFFIVIKGPYVTLITILLHINGSLTRIHALILV